MMYAVLMGLMSAALFGWVLSSEADEIGGGDAFVLLTALVLIFIAQFLFLYALERRLRAPERQWLLPAIASLLFAANAYFMAFYTLEAPTLYRVIPAVIAGSIFFAIVSVARLRPILALFAGSMLVISVFQYVYTRATLTADADVATGTVSLPVKSKRNVYLIGFESLQSPRAYRLNHDVTELPHLEVLKRLNFRILDGAYSAERSTMRSYSNIFEFRRQFNESDLGERSVFAYDNSTFRSFRDSGYAIQVLYKNNYFPINRKKVDFFFPPQGFDACDEMGQWYFYGLCQKKIVNLINRTIFSVPKMSWKEQLPLLQERTDVVAESKRPWLTWTHIKFPFHTHGYMQHPDPEYAAKFRKSVREALPIVADNMEKTVGHIVAVDPGAVIIVIGDHGTHLFRGDEKKVKKYVASNDPLWQLQSILEDQHGIMFAVYPGNFCVDRMSEPFSTKFLFESLIACLNGNDSPTIDERVKARTIRFLGDLSDVDELRAGVFQGKPSRQLSKTH